MARSGCLPAASQAHTFASASAAKTLIARPPTPFSFILECSLQSPQSESRGHIEDKKIALESESLGEVEIKVKDILSLQLPPDPGWASAPRPAGAAWVRPASPGMATPATTAAT